MNPQTAFLDLLIAAMKDAAIEHKLTQIQTQITPEETGKRKVIRIVIIPEELEHKYPTDQPLGTDPKAN